MKTNKVMVEGEALKGFFVCYRNTFCHGYLRSIEGLYRHRKFRPHVAPPKIKWRLRVMWKHLEWRYEE